MALFTFADAIDGCPHNSGMPSPREQVLDLVRDLVDLGAPNLHLCVTIRPEIDIMIKATLEPLTSLRMSLHDQSKQRQDIIEYISFCRTFGHGDAEMARGGQGACHRDPL